MIIPVEGDWRQLSNDYIFVPQIVCHHSFNRFDMTSILTAFIQKQRPSSQTRFSEWITRTRPQNNFSCTVRWYLLTGNHSVCIPVYETQIQVKRGLNLRLKKITDRRRSHNRWLSMWLNDGSGVTTPHRAAAAAAGKLEAETQKPSEGSSFSDCSQFTNSFFNRNVSDDM